MSDRDEFLTWVRTQLHDAEVALHNGDAGPRLQIWTQHDPVTVLGAWKSASGAAEVTQLFQTLETTFADCTAFTHEVIAAHVAGDLAYTVGYEHTSATVNGEPRSYTLRVTQVYRREGGQWRVAHRHADTLQEGAGT